MEITARPRRRGWVRALKVAIATACAASVALLVPAALGYSTHVVGDDAMAGGFPRGALVFDEQLAAGQLSVGDVVTLTPPGGELVVRRVLSVDDDGLRTGGDLTGEDPWVVPEAAASRVAFTVPGLGWPLLAVDSMSVPPWAPAGVAVGLVALLVGLRRGGRGHGTSDGRSGGVSARTVVAVRVDGVPAARSTPPAG